MTSNWKSLACWFSIGFLVLVAAGHAAQAATSPGDVRLAAALDTALRAALYGIKTGEVVVNGHVFRVASAHFACAGALTVIEGELACRRANGSHVPLHYAIRKRGATILSLEIRVAGQPASAWRRAGLTRYVVGTSLADEHIETVSARLGRMLDGNWQSAAELIVASVALRADLFGRDRLAMHRARLSHVRAERLTGARQSAKVIVVPRADRADGKRG
ncbi:MAG: hypothetical protein AB7O59_21990 [Pirellulales bacterium]